MIKRVFVLGMTALMLVACGGEAGKVNKDEFEGKIGELPECPYVAGEANIHVVQKSDGKVATDYEAKYEYAKQNGEWDVANSSGDTNQLTSFANAYEHTLALYTASIGNYMEYLENPQLTYYVNGETYGLKLIGKLDYSQIVASLKGKLDQTLKLTWDKYGMLQKWDLKASGKLEYAGQKISYEETDLITCSWR